MSSFPKASESALESELSASKIISLDERRDWFVAEIGKFVRAKREADNAMTREQFNSMDSIGKLFALKQALLDNTAAIYANDPDILVDPGMLTLIAVLSDNQLGYCDLSINRIAAFLSRSRSTIERAISRLKELGVIITEPIPGAPSGMRPFINHAFGSNRDSLTWLVDVYAPRPEQKPPGRPRKVDALRPENGTSPRVTYPFQKRYVSKVTGVPEMGTSPNEKGYVTTVTDKTTNYTTEEKKKIDVGVQLGLCISEGALDTFNRLYNTWGVKPGAIVFTEPHDRAVTDERLVGELVVYTDIDHSVLSAAFMQALNTTAAKADDGGAKGHGGGSSMLSFFRAVLGTSVKNLRMGEATLACEARAEVVVQQRRLEKRLAGVERGGSGRSGGGRASMDDLMEQAFSTQRVPNE